MGKIANLLLKLNCDDSSRWGWNHVESDVHFFSYHHLQILGTVQIYIASPMFLFYFVVGLSSFGIFPIKDMVMNAEYPLNWAVSSWTWRKYLQFLMAGEWDCERMHVCYSGHFELRIYGSCGYDWQVTSSFCLMCIPSTRSSISYTCNHARTYTNTLMLWCIRDKLGIYSKNMNHTTWN